MQLASAAYTIASRSHTTISMVGIEGGGAIQRHKPFIFIFLLVLVERKPVWGAFVKMNQAHHSSKKIDFLCVRV